MKFSSARILVVDDHEPGRYAKSRVLRGRGYEVVEAESGHAALEQVMTHAPDLVLLDVRLPDIDGITVCRRIKAALPQITVLQTSSARVDAGDRTVALESGADSYLVEPIEPAELIAVVRSLLRLRAAEQEVRRLNEDLEGRVAQRAAELAQVNHQLSLERDERRKAEDVLWHLQKLEAVGQLTGGIAHDFNNLLTVITGNIELVQEAIEGSRNVPKERLIRLLETALSAANQGAQVTQQLLAFARRSILNVEVVDLNAIIRSSSDLLHRALGEAIALEFYPAEGLWPCVIDPVQFEAALLNLAVNARDAMPGGGALRIESQNILIRPGDREVSGAAGIAPGRYVGVTVTDTGRGMEPEVLARVFEPFFTTKDVGQGSGLGLSQVYGFMKQSDGHVTVESSPGAGTVFRLYFPDSASLPRALGKADRLQAVGSGGGENILIVEDNEEVRAVVVDMVEDLGYRAIIAGDAKEALRLLRSDPSIDLLFTDIVMPNGMDGLALAGAARDLNVNIKVVLTSGYPKRTGAAQDVSNFALIQKPFRRSDLARVLRSALDG